MATKTFTASEQGVVDALVQEGFAAYAPKDRFSSEFHAGFVVMDGAGSEDGEPPMVVVNFATDQDNNEELALLVTKAYAKALEFNGYTVNLDDFNGHGDEAFLVCWEEN